jgi:hypothetical protein
MKQDFVQFLLYRVCPWLVGLLLVWCVGVFGWEYRNMLLGAALGAAFFVLPWIGGALAYLAMVYLTVRVAKAAWSRP